MIIRIYNNVGNASIQPQVSRVVRVYNYNTPNGLSESVFNQKGELLVGTGDGTYEVVAPGTDGYFLKYDSTQTAGVVGEPVTNVNQLINGGFPFAQRQTAGTFTTISNETYGPDRWKCTRENADLQYARQDGSGDSTLTSPYFGQFKKITNAGKFLLCQPLENLDTLKFRGQSLIFQLKMKASSSKTIKIAIAQLTSSGVADTLPTLVSAWGADTVDPTLGTNLSLIGAAQSCAVGTSFQTFSFTGSFPTTAKNLLVLVWTDADFAVNDTLSLAEVALYFGTTRRTWTPRHIQQELDLCLRYAQLPIGRLYGFCSSTTIMVFIYYPPVRFRTTPVGSLRTTTPSAESLPFVTGKTGAASAYSGTHEATESFDFQITGFTGLTLGNAATLLGGQVLFEAEL